MEKVVASKIVFECPIFKVEEADVQVPTGALEKRWYVVKRDAVGVVPVDAQGRILLTREYRSAAGEVRWRIPAGGVREGEQPDEAARRELREEVGVDCSELTPLLEAKSPSGMIKQRSIFYLAKGLYRAPLESGEWEDIKVLPVEAERAMELVRAGELQGNIAQAVTRAVDKLKSGGG